MASKQNKDVKFLCYKIDNPKFSPRERNRIFRGEASYIENVIAHLSKVYAVNEDSIIILNVMDVKTNRRSNDYD